MSEEARKLRMESYDRQIKRYDEMIKGADFALICLISAPFIAVGGLFLMIWLTK